MVSTIDEAKTPAELAEWLRVWSETYEEGVDYLDDNDARQLAEAVERVCTNGNAQALRDALTSFVDSVQWLCEGDERGVIKKQFAVLLSESRAALAAPARNCDRFPTELDAQLAFLNDVWLISVEKETMQERDKFENWTEKMKTRYGRWLFAPAKEGGAE